MVSNALIKPTLDMYRDFCIFMKWPSAERFIDSKIINAPNGPDEQVWADHNQMLLVLSTLARNAGELT